MIFGSSALSTHVCIYPFSRDALRSSETQTTGEDTANQASERGGHSQSGKRAGRTQPIRSASGEDHTANQASERGGHSQSGQRAVRITQPIRPASGEHTANQASERGAHSQSGQRAGSTQPIRPASGEHTANQASERGGHSQSGQRAVRIANERLQPLVSLAGLELGAACASRSSPSHLTRTSPGALHLPPERETSSRAARGPEVRVGLRRKQRNVPEWKKNVQKCKRIKDRNSTKMTFRGTWNKTKKI